MHFNLGMISYPEFMGIKNKGSCCHSHCKSLKNKKKARGRLERAKEQGTVVLISCSSDLKANIKSTSVRMLEFYMISSFYCVSKCAFFGI